DVESETGSTVSFGGKKWRKNLRQNVTGDAATGVTDPDSNVVILAGHRHAEFATIRSRHRIGGILENVDKCLNKLPAVDLNLRQTWSDAYFYFCALLLKIRLHEPDGIADNFQGVEALQPRWPLAAEIKHPPSHIFDTDIRPLDHLEIRS